MSIFSLPLPALRRRIVVSTLVSALLPIAAGCATAQMPSPPGVDMAIIDRESGRALPVYRSHGRSHVPGQPNARYAIRLVNHSPERRLVVLSVDGVNVITGATARWDQAGYVLDPGQSADITGWRKSDAEVAAFVFAALSDSYAARTGRPGQVGVIGMAEFAERAPPVSYLPSPVPASPPARLQAPAADGGAKALGETAAAGSVAPAPAPRERLGTAHGEREWSQVSRTRFVRSTPTPQAVVEIAYDSHANLVAAGIIRQPLAQRWPRAFPLDGDSGGFVADPPSR